jgi:hypothetical protein
MDSHARGLHIDEVLLERLAELGKNNSLSVSALLNELITNYLEENDPNWLKNNEKRLFKRKRVMIPAMIYKSSESELVGRYHSTTILDISLGGMRLSFAPESTCKNEIDKDGSEFEVLFSLDKEGEPVVLRCNLARIKNTELGIQVGASFCEANAHSHEYLQKYLM